MLARKLTIFTVPDKESVKCERIPEQQPAFSRRYINTHEPKHGNESEKEQGYRFLFARRLLMIKIGFGFYPGKTAE